jgi:hypothetical protein
VSSPLPIGGDRRAALRNTSVDQRTGESGDELDEIGLMFDAGLLKEMAEVGLDRAVCDPERLGNIGAAPDLDESEQNAQFGGRQLVSPGDGLPPRPP